MNARYRGRLCSRHFSCNCPRENTISVVERLVRNPHCDSGYTRSASASRRFRTTLAKAFPTILSRDSAIVVAVATVARVLVFASRMSWGIVPSSQHCNRSSWRCHRNLWWDFVAVRCLLRGQRVNGLAKLLGSGRQVELFHGRRWVSVLQCCLADDVLSGVQLHIVLSPSLYLFATVFDDSARGGLEGCDLSDT